ncbi:MAG: hypothetical protein ACXVPK_11360 [Tumebacillaceae bacterium]
MNWHFNDLQNMKEFCGFLSDQFISKGECKWSKEFEFFSTNTFTTSTEYLGELKISLTNLLEEKGSLLTKNVLNDVHAAIVAISQALK